MADEVSDDLYTVPCHFCGEPVDAVSRTTWRRVVGWERKAQASTRKSGSDIALREPRDEYACPDCVDRRRAGVVGQGTLL